MSSDLNTVTVTIQTNHGLTFTVAVPEIPVTSTADASSVRTTIVRTPESKQAVKAEAVG